MADHEPTNYRRHRAVTDRNLLIGFFVVMLLVGGSLIFLFYGGLAGVEGVVCLLGVAGVSGVVALITFGFEKLSDWLEDRD